jgi:hypothetical protein
MKTSKHAIVVDQTLKSLTGHHFEVSMAIANQYINDKYNTFIACNIAADPKLINQYGWVPTFKQNWSDRTILQFLISFLDLIFVILKKPLGLFKFSRKFGWQLNRLVHTTSLGNELEVFVHTLNFVQLAEVITLSNLLERPIRYRAVLRQDPREGTNSLLKVFYFFLLRQALKKSSNIFLYSDTKALAREYQRILGVMVEPMQIPLKIPQGIAVKDPARFTFCYLGDARTEKGFQHLPKIIEECFDKDSQITFAVQVNLVGINRENPTLRRSVERLRSISSASNGRLVILDGDLSEDVYYQTLMSSRAVLLPYDPVAYKFRSSGIFAQAMALGKFAVVPMGSAFAEENESVGVIKFNHLSEIISATSKKLNLCE